MIEEHTDPTAEAHAQASNLLRTLLTALATWPTGAPNAAKPTKSTSGSRPRPNGGSWKSA